MPTKKQARINLKKRMVEKDLRVTQLAARLGHHHSVISKAINHGRFPRVVAKIKEVLA